MTIKKILPVILIIIPILASCAVDEKSSADQSPTTTNIADTATPSPSPMPSLTPAAPIPVAQMTAVPYQDERITAGNAENLQLLAEWGRGRLLALSLSADGDSLIAASAVGAAQYHTDDLEMVQQIEYEYCRQALISPGQTYIALTTFEEIRVMDFASGKMLLHIPLDSGLSAMDASSVDYYDNPTTLLFSPDEHWLAIGSISGVQIWDMSTYKLILNLNAFNGNLENWFMAFSPDSQKLATAPVKGYGEWNTDANLKVWEPSSGALLYEVKDKLMTGADIYGLAFSADGQQLFSIVSKWDPKRFTVYQMISWACSDGSYLNRFELDDWRYLKQALPDGSLLVFDGTHIELINSVNGAILRELPVSVDYENYTQLFSLASEAEILAINTADGIQVLDLNSSDLVVNDLKLVPNLSSLLAISANAVRFLVKSADNSSYLVDRASSEILLEIPADQMNSCGAAFSLDGSLLAVAGTDSAIYLYNTTSGEVRYQFSGHRTPPCYLEFSPDGRLLASASGDRSIFVWDTQDGQQLAQFASDVLYNGFLSFSPDSHYLAASAGDGITLWNTEDWQAAGFYQDDDIDSFGVVLFSQDGNSLIAQGLYKNALIEDAVILNTGTMQKEKDLELENGAFLFGVGPDDTLYVASSLQGTISTIKLQGGTSSKIRVLPDTDYASLVKSTGGTNLAGLDFNGQVFLLPLASLPENRLLSGYLTLISQIKLSLDNDRLAIFTSSENLYLLDINNGTVQSAFSAAKYNESLLDISPDFKQVVTYGYDEIYDKFDILIREIDSGQLIDRLASVTKTPISAQFTPAGNYLLLSGYSSNNQSDIILFEFPTGEQIFQRQFIGYPQKLEISNIGDKAIINVESSLYVLALPGGAALAKVSLGDLYISQANFSQDESSLIYSIEEWSDSGFFFDRKYRYDLISSEIEELSSSYPSGIYSPDGSLVIDSSTTPNKLLIAESGIKVTDLGSNGNYYSDWIFSKNGDKIFGVSTGGVISVFGIHPYQPQPDDRQQNAETSTEIEVEGQILNRFSTSTFQPTFYNEYINDHSVFKSMYASHRYTMKAWRSPAVMERLF